MPRYARPANSPSLEPAINAFGNQAKVAIIGFLAANGPATRSEVAAALDIGVSTAKHNLMMLAEDGVINQDPPASEERNGRRVRYSLNTAEVSQRYSDLGAALGIGPQGEPDSPHE